MYLIAGLGNPEKKYEATRHNIGFETVDLLCHKNGIALNKLKHKALFGEYNVGGQKVIVAKPQTYMNLSGESVVELMNWYKVPMENLIVCYDDIDLEFGRLRIRKNGSAGTHNGMRSIIYLLGRDDFPRVRGGIGRAPAGWDLADCVRSVLANGLGLLGVAAPEKM